MSAGAQVAFNNTPGDVRVPIFMAELNAGPPSYSGNSRQIVFGRALGGAMAQTRVAINTGSTDPNALCGIGSIGAEQLLYARRRNPLGEIWFMDVGAPSGGGTAATGTIAITGTATAPGTLTRYIGGERYDVGVGIGDTATIVAAALAARIGKGYVKFDHTMGAPVTAAAATGTVTLTARHPGVEGNWINIESGLDGDEVEVPGLTVTVTAMASGAGDADMASALAALGAMPFDWLTSPYGTTAQVNAARDFLSDTGAGRWSPLVGLQGHYITVYEGNLSALTSFGAGRNDQHTSILGTNKYPQPRWCWAAALGGEIAFRKNLGRTLKTAVEIARPMQTLVLEGLRPPKDPTNIFAPADRDSLYRNGISAVVFRDDGQAACDRIITTYQRNAAGLPDTTFLNIEAVCIGAYVIRYMKNALLGKYPRCVMLETNPGNIQGVVTPPQAKGTCVHAYTDLNNAGLVRQVDLFTRYLIVDFDYDNDRANFYLPAAKAAALRVFATNVTLFSSLTDDNASGL